MILTKYMSRKEGRGLSGIEEYVDASIQGLEDYIRKNKERLIRTASKSIDKIRTDQKITRITKQKCEEKQMYQDFPRQTNKIAHEKTQTWPRKGNPKKETESLLIIARNNAIRGNWVEFSPIVRETGVQSQVESYQRLKKWYLMSLCLTLRIIR